MTAATHWTDRLVELRACPDAVEWARTQPDLATAWATCERVDWMLWLAGRVAGPPGDDSRRPLVLAACECAERVLPLIRNEWAQAIATAAIQTAQAWAHGEATIEEVRAAKDATTAAADAAPAGDREAALAAAYAAGPADEGDAVGVAVGPAGRATAVMTAGHVPWLATLAAEAVRIDAARLRAPSARRPWSRPVARGPILCEMADIVRRHYPEPPRIS